MTGISRQDYTVIAGMQNFEQLQFRMYDEYLVHTFYNEWMDEQDKNNMPPPEGVRGRET